MAVQRDREVGEKQRAFGAGRRDRIELGELVGEACRVILRVEAVRVPYL
jgi:hypothetical protein